MLKETQSRSFIPCVIPVYYGVIIDYLYIA